MRAAALTALLLALLSCGKSNYTNEDLEGTWESTDTSWAKVRMIFDSGSVRIFHPVQHGDRRFAHIFDSASTASVKNLFRYKLHMDTIWYGQEFRFITADKNSTESQYKHIMIINRLNEDTLSITEPEIKMRSDFVRIKQHVQAIP